MGLPPASDAVAFARSCVAAAEAFVEAFEASGRASSARLDAALARPETPARLVDLMAEDLRVTRRAGIEAQRVLAGALRALTAATTATARAPLKRRPPRAPDAAQGEGVMANQPSPPMTR